uniref:Dilute domain-containing protein n=1 Tax=Vannella robusta TaxID=1487602 RepID=A0A7S4M4R0_9EUKA
MRYQIVECCLVYLSRKLLNLLLGSAGFCTAENAVAMKYSIVQLLRWASDDDMDQYEVYEQCCDSALFGVNLMLCIANPATLKTNKTFLRDLFQVLNAAEVIQLTKNMAENFKVDETLMSQITKTSAPRAGNAIRTPSIAAAALLISEEYLCHKQ